MKCLNDAFVNWARETYITYVPYYLLTDIDKEYIKMIATKVTKNTSEHLYNLIHGFMSLEVNDLKDFEMYEEVPDME
jgi:hypothetical protein